MRFTNGKWEDILNFVINKYNTNIHSTTNHTPIEAHKDKKSPDVIVNLTMNSNYKRKYNNINVGDTVKVFTKGTNNYTSRKETVSKWSNDTYIVKQIDRDVTLNKYYALEGLTKRYSSHEILLVK